MARPISLQLYSLREQAKKDFVGTLKLVADIGYAGVEPAGLHGMKAADVKKVLDDLGLKATGAHVPVFDPAKTQDIIADAKALGLSCVGGGFGPKDFETEAAIKAAADKVNAACDRFAAAGLKVYLHNHWWEWDAPNKGELLLKLCPKVYIEWDIYWVQTGGADPAKLIQRYLDRTLLIHVKDGPCEKGKAHTAVGKGKVNTPAVLAAAEKSKAEWYIVELDACDTDMVQAVRDSYTYLVGKKLATGRK